MTIEEQFDTNDLVEDVNEEQLNLVGDEVEEVSEDELNNVPAEKPKNKKKKKAKKVTAQKSIVELDFSEKAETAQMLKNIVKDSNNKDLGKKITSEDVVEFLINQYVKNNYNECIFQIQKKSLSSDEIDNLLKSQFVQ